MEVLRSRDINLKSIELVLGHYNLNIIKIESGRNIPGSYWKPPEAGIIGNNLYIRDDTPVHSALHESSHYICMDKNRRKTLDTDARGGYEEENAVCYLQLLLARELEEVGMTRMFNDMDTWGYTFRLGSSKKWFERDAQETVKWLQDFNIITADYSLTWELRI